MVDSGQLISNGRVDFYNVYKSMVEHELARPPQAEIEAYASRVGDKVKFSIKLTNLSGVTLSYWSNYATVHGIVYEDAKVGVTNRIVREAVYESIYSEVSPDSSGMFNLETSDLTDVNWDNLHFLALVDYRPQGASGPYDILQAAPAQSIDFSIHPNQLTFLVDPGEQTTPTVQLNLVGSNTLNWTASEDIAWLSVSPTNGTVPASPLVSVDTSKLSLGWQPEGQISFIATNGDGVHFDEEVSVSAYYGPINRVHLPIVER
jgi:hypothetical protein